ncbi:site-specific integrase [Aquimarina sp. 2201CG1-2-11]|uniref:tyrosine-type recombinase/integrase n=1 Tax=Aquimarina discodermiae TaxID=3231043 RepID=UPI003461F674
MKRKKLPLQKHKGLFIYCNHCRKDFSWTQKKVTQESGNTIKEEPLCGDSEKKYSSCKFSAKHKFRSRIYIPGTQRIVSKSFNVNSYNDAVKKAIDFEKEIKNPESENQPYLFDSQLLYIEFLKNIGVPLHQQVQRTSKHIKEVYKALKQFNKTLTINRVNTRIITINQITDDHIGFFHAYLIQTKKYQNKTYNNKMSAVKGFFKWTIENYELNKSNPFDKVRRRKTVIKKETITRVEFQNLLKIISPERGVIQMKGKRKQKRNLYKPYLKDGIELALYTGGRREEIVSLKWNMIHEKDNIPIYIEMRNLKVERQLGDGFNEEVTPKIIPITKDLRELLHRLGYNKHKGKNRFLLHPNRSKSSTAYMMDSLSKGFSHFYNLLGTNRKLQLKSLRKTYLTYLHSTIGADTKYLSSHTSDNVLQKHYIDETIVSKAILRFEIFNE